MKLWEMGAVLALTVFVNYYSDCLWSMCFFFLWRMLEKQLLPWKKQVLAKAFKEKEGDMFGVAMSGRGGEGSAAGWKPLLSASSVKFIFNFDSV